MTQAIWYFIGCAILVGLVAALVLHGIFRTFVLIFGLDRKLQPKPKDKPAKGHDVKSYRKAREQKRKQVEKEQEELDQRARALANSPLLKDALRKMYKRSHEDASSPRSNIAPNSSLLDTMIMEQSAEEDS